MITGFDREDIGLHEESHAEVEALRRALNPVRQIHGQSKAFPPASRHRVVWGSFRHLWSVRSNFWQLLGEVKGEHPLEDLIRDERWNQAIEWMLARAKDELLADENFFGVGLRHRMEILLTSPIYDYVTKHFEISEDNPVHKRLFDDYKVRLEASIEKAATLTFITNLP